MTNKKTTFILFFHSSNVLLLFIMSRADERTELLLNTLNEAVTMLLSVLYTNNTQGETMKNIDFMTVNRKITKISSTTTKTKVTKK